MKKEFISVLIVAAGSGKRMQSGKNKDGTHKNKMFLNLSGKSILARSLLIFENFDEADEIVVVTRGCDIKQVEDIKEKYNIKKIVRIIEGGDTRQKSVLKGLGAIDERAEFVLIHDGARCLTEQNCIKACLDGARKYGAAAPGVKVKDSIKKVDENGFVECDIARENLVNIQTPQVFSVKEILNVHQKAKDEGFSTTDDSALFSRYGKRVYITKGSYENLKITTSEDLILAEEILKKREQFK